MAWADCFLSFEQRNGIGKVEWLRFVDQVMNLNELLWMGGYWGRLILLKLKRWLFFVISGTRSWYKTWRHVRLVFSGCGFQSHCLVNDERLFIRSTIISFVNVLRSNISSDLFIRFWSLTSRNYMHAAFFPSSLLELKIAYLSLVYFWCRNLPTWCYLAFSKARGKSWLSLGLLLWSSGHFLYDDWYPSRSLLEQKFCYLYGISY